MERADLRLAIVALEARIRRLEPALEVLAADPEDGPRLKAIAARLRANANGYAPINYAADELERIAALGAGVLALPAPELLGLALEVINKLHREPATNRFSKRRDAALEDRRARRVAKSDRLQAIAKGARGSEKVVVH